MIQGLYTAASGLMAVERRQDIISNNIANASTPGFKRQDAVQFGFSQVFSETMRKPFHFNLDSAPGGGVKFLESFPDVTEGTLRPTDNPLNAGLMGPGFFAVDTPRGDRFTRSGDFTIDSAGHLATQSGYKVQSVDGGPLDVRGGTVIIDEDGTVRVNSVPAGQLRLVEFENPTRLEREGDSLYAATEEVGAGMNAAAETTVVQSQLEMSNVSVPVEMVRMMLGMRAYEANQKVIMTLDDSMGRLIDQVAMP